jgi:hypothetical protein
LIESYQNKIAKDINVEVKNGRLPQAAQKKKIYRPSFKILVNSFHL